VFNTGFDLFRQAFAIVVPVDTGRQAGNHPHINGRFISWPRERGDRKRRPSEGLISKTLFATTGTRGFAKSPLARELPDRRNAAQVRPLRR